jgi:AAA-like domain/TIR domain
MALQRDCVFISYSHKDKKWLEEFLPHLKAFEREVQMNIWVDSKIRAGARWLDEIQTALSTARVAVLLVSANYLASEFIASQEVPPVLAAEKSEGLRIIWVPVSASAWSLTAIKEFQSASDPARTLDRMPLARRNEKWAEIARTIYDAMTEHYQPVEAMQAVDDVEPKDGRVVLLYKRNAEPDESLLRFLETELTKKGHEVYIDRHIQAGIRWAAAISNHLEKAAAVIPLLSAASVKSEMLGFEIRIAYHASQRQKGRPRVLPVRVAFGGDLDSPFDLVSPIQHFIWKTSADNAALANDLIRALSQPAAEPVKYVPSPGGGVRRDDPFYVERPSDTQFREAVARRESVILVKGARQMGKTSLLGRGLQAARKLNFKTTYTDFQRLNVERLGSLEMFYQSLVEWLSRDLNLDIDLESEWNLRRSANYNLERILRSRILDRIEGHLIWGMDEVDRLFALPFSGEFFGLIRAWHNDRALSQDSPWERLTVAIFYATEAYAFIKGMDQSPFNVGVDIELDDFTVDQVNALNEKFGAPLPDWKSVDRFHELLGGQPYLVRRGLSELSEGRFTLEQFMEKATLDDGPYRDHLRRLLMNLARKPALIAPVQSLLKQGASLTMEDLYSLRRAGIAVGASPQSAKLRCLLYETYLSQHLPAETRAEVASS